jgi:ornithine--oxo-acid transaminase
MNGGVEGTETAVKLARRWGYVKKGIPDNHAKVLLPHDAFWGRTITAGGASDDPPRYRLFGPHTPGFEFVDYNDVEATRKIF